MRQSMFNQSDTGRDRRRHPRTRLQMSFRCVRVEESGANVLDSMEMLGPDMSRARIRHAIEVLGGVSKKAMKRLEKQYQGL